MVRSQRWKQRAIFDPKACSIRPPRRYARRPSKVEPGFLEVRVVPNAKVDLLKSVSLFSGMGKRELEQVAQLLDEVHVPAGKVLMRQGQNGNDMFVIARGRVKVERNGKVISERGPGTAMGEMSLLSEGPRNATVTSVEDSTLLYAGHREFHSLMDQFPSVRMCVLEGLVTKIRALDESGVH
jgi:CRP-like cAMP-binding protein